MQKLFYVSNSGASAEFCMSQPYIFWKIEGLGIPPVSTVSTQAPGQHGESVHSILLESRDILLTGHIHCADIRKMYEERKRLQAAINPLSGSGVLYYENDSGKYRIPAIPIASPYLAKVFNVQTLNVRFLCPSPFWQSDDETEIKLAYVDGGFEFPIATPGFFGTLGYRAEIFNDGDAPIPLEITIGGGAINPEITNAVTGERIYVERQIMLGDMLYINTDPEQLQVTLHRLNLETNTHDRENAYGYLSSDSALLNLRPGRSELIFRSKDDNKKVTINIKFRKRFVGV